MSAPRAFLIFTACALPCAFLGGCNVSADRAGNAAIQAQADSAIRPSGASPRPAALAVTQMDAPEPLKTRFMALFDADVAQRDVSLTDSAGAHYLARGYLSAYPIEDGARLTYVWDIYDRNAHRAQRINDEITLKGAAADPWSLVDASALKALAQRSAGELAAYLSNTPEALAAQPQTAAATAPAAAPLAYAPAH
jgi:hypothetical protein